MKTCVLLACLAVTAVAFDGSGSITSDADLAAMSLPPSRGRVHTAVDGGFHRAGVCSGGDITRESRLSHYTDCVEVRGCLNIVGLSVEKLDAFTKLERIVADATVKCTGITEGLRIAACPNLKDLDAFDKLERVDGDVIVSGHEALKSTSKLGTNLRVVTGSVQISDNAELADVGASWDFHNGQLPGSLTVEENALLANIRGFQTVQHAGGVKVCGSNELQSLAGLEKLTLVGEGGLTICNNAALHDTSAIKGVVNIAGSLELTDNAVVKDMSGFNTIMNVGNNAGKTSVLIKNNGQLKTVTLGTTSVTGSIEIENNPNLAVLDMSGLTTIGSNKAGQSVRILKNENLKDLSGLRGLQGALTGAIVLAENKNLLSLNGLQQVLSAGRDNSGVSLAIRDNAHLATTAGLAMTGKLEGGVHIMRNPQLKVLAGLQAVSEIGADNQGVALAVHANKLLTDLVGFEGLQSIAGAAEINGNSAMMSLDGFANLKTITGVNAKGTSLEIISNSNLANANALQTLVMVSGGIDVEGNTKLENVVSLLKGLKSATRIVVHDVLCISSADVAHINDVATNDVDVEEATSVTACISRDLTTVKLNKLRDPASFGDAANTQVGGLAEGRICGGKTSDANGIWKPVDMGVSKNLRISVDTSKCKFSATGHTPRYVTSISGESAHWQLIGVNSVYSAFPDKFELNLWHPTLRGNYLVYFAARYRWSVNWLADTSKRSGNTKAGSTGWKAVPNTKNAIYADVNTQKSGYSHPNNAAPRYVTAIHGGSDHWKVQGAHAVYNPTPQGFRIFLVYPSAITPEFAEKNGWSVVWVGSYDDKTSGIGSNTWLSYRGTALQQTVHTLGGMYRDVPTYVTSISGRSHHWMVTGAGSIYDAGRQSFKVFLDRAKTPKFAKEHDWRVNYIAYSTPEDCQVSRWSRWSACSKTCGADARQTRTRTVVTKAYFGGKCDMELEDHDPRRCARDCPIDCQWSAWSAFGPCTQTCRDTTGRNTPGRATRTRYHAVNAANGGQVCTGPEVQVITCGNDACPIHCEASSWGNWGRCLGANGDEVKCGGGRRSRSRSIIRHDAFGGTICPSVTDDQLCATKGCPRECVLSAWSSWGDCLNSNRARTCGTGVHTRRREILVAPTGDNECEGECADGFCSETRACDIGPCPVNCVVTPWHEPSTCSKSCGGGVTYQHRRVHRHAEHGGFECPALVRHATCNTEACPRDCQVSAWGGWGKCSKECLNGAGDLNGGYKIRTRHIVTPGRGGSPCPPLLQKDTCNRHLCPIDCEYSSWAYGGCSKSCGQGTRTHSRTVVRLAAHGGKTCEELYGAPTKTEECNEMPCGNTCVMNPWQGWSTCTLTCNGGVRYRKRTIRRGDHSNCPHTEETQACNTHRCPINCLLTGWGSWSRCSSNCDASNGGYGGRVGGGFKDRRRKAVTMGAYGGEPCGEGLHKMWEERPCNKGAVLSETCLNPDGCLCPIDCVVAQKWSDNGKCLNTEQQEVTCGGGSKHQIKRVLQRPFGTGMRCPSSATRGRFVSCATTPCPVDCKVGEWDFPNWADAPCLNRQGNQITCGGGRKTRTRKLTEAVHGGKKCHLVTSGGEVQSKSCNDTPCPIDCQLSGWGESQDQADSDGWLPCSASCRRDATNGQPMGPAPTQKRMRFVKRWGNKWGKACCPSNDLSCLEQQRTCNKKKFCPVDCQAANWGNWGKCTVTCGTGRQTRTRGQVQDERHDGRSCNDVYGKGWDTESRACDMGACPVKCNVSSWAAWTSCKNDSGKTVTCGGGRKTRTRDVLTKGHTGVCPVLEETEVCNSAPCPINCKLGEWEDWNAARNSQVRRFRKILTPAEFGGQTCETLCAQDARTEECKCKGGTCSETTGWQMVPQYSTACAGILGLSQTGEWSKCDKNCKSGHQYRYVIKAMCSKTSVMKVHFKFRQGKFCNTQDSCVDLNGEALPEFVSPKPRIPALARKSVFNDYTGPDTAPSMRPYTKPNTGAVRDGNGNRVSQLPGSIMLDEELSWKTLSHDEVVMHGLEPGHWQVQV